MKELARNRETEISEEEGKKIFYISEIRKDFPILHQKINKKPFVYFDNAATTQKPRAVIDAVKDYYQNYNSNIHRGVHNLSQQATKAYEEARGVIAKFINATRSPEVIFTRGTTESINLVAQTYGRKNIKEGDEVLITWMEHHSNIVPWQMLCEETGAKLRVVPINDKGEIIYEEFRKMIKGPVKLAAFVHISNTLGTINPVEDMIKDCHAEGIPVLLDAAQSVQHIGIDVQELRPEFMAFSGHKIYGPTGIGVLYGRKEYLDAMPPYQGGGDMIKTVSFDGTKFNDLPYKFEAGTQNIAGAIGLAEAIKYIRNLGLDAIAKYEKDLLDYATELAGEVPGLRIIGTAEEKTSSLSFVLDNVHPHDVGTLLDMNGVAVRTGHHCTEPLMKFFDVPATSRASFAFYNTREEVRIFAEALQKVVRMFGSK